LWQSSLFQQNQGQTAGLLARIAVMENGSLCGPMKS
jgi:hypothetical protein